MDLENNELHTRLLCSVMAIVQKEAKQLKMSVALPVTRVLGDMVIQYMEILARDLEMFAQHAGRKSVTMDDVMLSARRNPDVAAKLKPLVQELTKISKKNKEEKLRRKKESTEGSKKQECGNTLATSPRKESSHNATGEASASTEKRQRT